MHVQTDRIGRLQSMFHSSAIFRVETHLAHPQKEGQKNYGGPLG